MKISQEEFNKQVAQNLISYRKFNNLTQLSLAEKLNYSDKAVWKWESGECLPDVYVLQKIANIYGVTVNDLLVQKAKPKASPSKINRFFIPTLSCAIVWLVALVVFFILKSFLPTATNLWLAFIVAIPVTFIVELVFSCIYKNLLLQFISISAIIWTTVLSLHLMLYSILSQIILLYLVAIAIEVLAILWYLYILLLNKKKSK